MIIDEMRYYCKPCLEHEKKAGKDGHISKVVNFATSTSSGTMALHLSVKHNIRDEPFAKVDKILGYLQKYDKPSASSANTSLSSHEFNRDLIVWFCRDLIPFGAVAKDGMIGFFRKLFPDMVLPTPDTLSGHALDDVYVTVHSQVKDMLREVKSICLMFDGWTDRYRGKPYLGLRASFIKDWSYHVVTLGCHVLPVHSSREIADHILKVVAEFVPDIKKVFLTTCHDGAANMVKASQLMKVENFQHCTAHAMHLLLTTDSISQVEEITSLLQKCRNIVTSLHFKSTLIAEELAATEDKTVINKLQKAMNDVNDLLDVDDQYPLEDDVVDKDIHHHVTLKSSCPTCWNSSLSMIQSLLDMKREVMNCLKRIGKVDMCLHTDEVELLEELRKFLQPFESFTELVSTTTATVSLNPLIKLQIRKMCSAADGVNDSPPMQSVKKKILDKLDHRLPEK